MADVMMPRKGKLIVGVLLLCMISFPLLFHLGPKLGTRKGQELRCQLALEDGSILFLVQMRNASFIEAYSSCLYRLYKNDKAEIIGLGYEDSYWWFADLRPSASKSNIEMRIWGTTEGIYDPKTGVAYLSGEKISPIDPYPIPPGDSIKPKLREWSKRVGVEPSTY